jgi:GNAT superfamily N-acetyltransferase
MTPFERNAANLSASLELYGDTEQKDGLKLIRSSVDYSVFNIALLEFPLPPDAGHLESAIENAGRYFREKETPWSFWVCEDYIGRRAARRLENIFDSFDMTPIADTPGMETARLAPSERPLPPITARRVEDPATRTDFAHLVSTSFNVPAAVTYELYVRRPRQRPGLTAWVGYREDIAVTTTLTARQPGAIGLYSVSTLPGYRRKGYAEALMRTAIACAQQDAAQAGEIPEWLLLQSSSAGLKLYRKLGFRRITRFQVFATR